MKMIGSLIKRLFGTKDQRDVQRLQKLVAQSSAFEQTLRALSNEALRHQTAVWQAELSKIENHEVLATRLDEIAPQAFGLVREACRRLCGHQFVVRGHQVKWEMVPFDMQMVGGYALHSGRIAEMATGEGKTLVATLPVYLNALSGKGVHVVTVNDYLAARDSEWMGVIYRFLGLTVGCILSDQPAKVRQAQYLCDITYGTSSEFGFDYLRDNGMVTSPGNQVQRGHHFAIVDEVDSILIDEARTPLLISGAPLAVGNELYTRLESAVATLHRAQEQLCSEMLNDAAQHLLADRKEEAGLLIYRVKLGQPRSAKLLVLLEDPQIAQLLEQTENRLHMNQKKTELFAQKDTLFFAIDEKRTEADLTDKGRQLMCPGDPDAFVLPDLASDLQKLEAEVQEPARLLERKAQLQQDYASKAQRVHATSQLLKAFSLYQRDVHYVVQDNRIVIVDENTGRLMPNRRWSDGLHQAIEAKEGVALVGETQTLATITLQNYFRLYHKLAGMTGTAETEAQEFHNIYGLDVLVIPSNKPVCRQDADDFLFRTKREKFTAVIGEIKAVHSQGRPILVGTASVEVSEQLSRWLQKEAIIHSVLNAKYHQQEAEIIARAGQRGAITIATNMAGRGTDIRLGEGVATIGGLHIIGTERHESRRVDRQLRGRCARQGDPGSSHFFVSIEDDLMRLFGSSLANIIQRIGVSEGQQLEHPLLSRAVQQAQKKVEQQNFQARKHTLEYDDVLNTHRKVIYGFRHEMVHCDDPHARVMQIVDEVVTKEVEDVTDGDNWDPQRLFEWVAINFPAAITRAEIDQAFMENDPQFGLLPKRAAVTSLITERIGTAYQVRISALPAERAPMLAKSVALYTIDQQWQEHLSDMEALQQGIGLRAYGQRDPLLEYKAESFKIFDQLMADIKREICRGLFQSTAADAGSQREQKLSHQNISAFAANKPVENSERVKPIQGGRKVGRNEPCPCGSTRKFKLCCGAV
jgi:preprotein translocase subunit SecA